MTDETSSVPRRSRLTLVLAHLLAAVLAALGVFAALTGLVTEGSLDPRVLWLGVAFVSAPIVAALAWSVVARWDDRVELWADRLVRWERGRSEMFLLPEVARFDARLSTVRGGIDLETPVGLRVVMTDGRVLAVDDLPLRRARLLMQLVVSPPASLVPAVQQELAALVRRSLGDPAHYLDSVDKALAEAKQSGKPVFWYVPTLAGSPMDRHTW